MKIIAIVVVYRPDILQLKKTISSIISQIDCCIIIINGKENINLTEYRNLFVINLDYNYGIAYAQNIGIRQAIKYGAKFIILSDQDTIYPKNYVDSNLTAYENIKYSNIAALVPVYYDIEKNIKSPIMLTKFTSTMDYSLQYVQTAQAISSGSFIITEVIIKVGLMNEKLFIDYVDFEWCWRAVDLGYKIITVPKIVINHKLGENIKRIANRNIFIRNKMRYYYIIRNGCYLAIHSPWLRIHERILLIKKVAIQILAFIIISPKNLVNISNALCEGISGRMKKYNKND